MQFDGKIEMATNQEFLANVDFTDEQRDFLNQHKNLSITVSFDDERHITASQRRKIFAMIHEFAEATGNWGRSPIDHESPVRDVFSDDYAEYLLKNEFRYETGYYKYFSFANCSRELASQFIAFLIDTCFKYNIKFSTQFIDGIRGNYKYEWYCYKNRVCEVCNKSREDGYAIDVAHVHAVGLGRNRNTINHIGNRIMFLCREHHQYQHQIGIEDFMQLYQLKGIEVTKEVADDLKLGRTDDETKRDDRFQ